MKSIAIDIDGILTNETEGHDYKNRTPNLAAIKLVNLLMVLGFDVYLFTARYPVDKDVTREWLVKHGVKCNRVLFGKPKYDFIVDDRAI